MQVYVILSCRKCVIIDIKVFLTRRNTPSDNIFIVKTMLLETRHGTEAIAVIFERHHIRHIDGTLEAS